MTTRVQKFGKLTLVTVGDTDMAGFTGGLVFRSPYIPFVFVRIWRHVFQLQWR